MYVEKQKIEKEKNKKGGKGKTKATLRMEEDNVSHCRAIIKTSTSALMINHIFVFISQANIKEYGQFETYDYDDFM